MKKLYILFFITILSCSKHNNQTSNLIKIKPTDNEQTIIEKSTLVIPTPQQLQWQQKEFIAFIHFGPNTFTGVEWGTGKESPQVFNPTELDTKQWMKNIKKAGMKMAMLTAKHHDGFCLWQTNTTNHSVKNSPWKNGKGDVLKEVSEAAQKEGIGIGVYLSPANLHEIERTNGTYGNGSKPKKTTIPSDKELQKTAKQIFEYNLNDYDALFMNQLYEVLTQYGEIDEVWFDGANPKPGTGQTYNRKAWYDLIKKLQPNALIAIKGPDVRWCGNEAGRTRKNEWSVVPLPKKPSEFDWSDMTKDDLGSRKQLKNVKYLYWYPAETNTSIRSGWFYRDDKQYIKSVEELIDIWYRSVGGNSVFLLNVTPDKRGLLPQKDVETLSEVGEILKTSFSKNLISEVASIKANDEKVPINLLADNDITTVWKPKQNTQKIDLILSFKKKITFNRLVLQEGIASYGQRIEKFDFEYFEKGKWKEVVSGTTVGYKNIRRFPTVTTSKVRLRILESRIKPTLATIGLYKAPEILSNPEIQRTKNGEVTIHCKTPDPKIYYTLNGENPTEKSMMYKKSFLLPKGGMVKAIAYANNFREKSEIMNKQFDVCSEKWSVVSVSSEHSSYQASNAIDGNSKTIWHTPWKDKTKNFPHFITIDLGEFIKLKGFSYLPRTDGNKEGICEKYQIETSSNGTDWQLQAKGNFQNIKNNPVLQEVMFKKQVNARYIKFVGLSNTTNSKVLSAAEIGVLTQ